MRKINFSGITNANVPTIAGLGLNMAGKASLLVFILAFGRVLADFLKSAGEEFVYTCKCGLIKARIVQGEGSGISYLVKIGCTCPPDGTMEIL